MNPWMLVLISQLIVISIGLTSLLFFVRISVFEKHFNGYSRFCFGCVSMAMICMISTSGLRYLDALNEGKIVDEEVVSNLSRRHILLCIRSYGGIILVATEFLSTIEKLASITFPNFHRIHTFVFVFFAYFFLSQLGAVCHVYAYEVIKDPFGFRITFGVANTIEVLNLSTLIILYYNSKYIYFKTCTKIKPQLRYQLTEAYEWCQCLVPSFIFSAVSRIIIFSNIWLNLLVINDTRFPYYFFITELLLHTYCMIFPWTVLLNHPKCKKQVLNMFCTSFRKVLPIETLQSINGRMLNLTTNPNASIDQFKSS